MLLLRLGPVASRVRRIPGVKDASVTRRFPSTIVIHVTERVALVQLDLHPELAADDTGTLFPAPKGAVLPAVSGWTGNAAPGSSLDDRSRVVLGAYAAFPEGLRARAKSLSVGRSTVLVLRQAIEIRFGLPEQLEAKAAAAWAIVQHAEADGEHL